MKHNKRKEHTMGFMFRANSYTARLKPGLYSAELVEIEEREGDHGGYLIWRFNVSDEADEETLVTALSSQKFGSGSKARQYCEAILNRVIQPGEEVAPKSLYGHPCQVLVTIATLSDGSTANRVEQILPLKDDDDVPF
jgi:hypothetical protein